jgi:hypothetical protein
MSYERRSGYGGGFKPCPVEMGKEYEVDITETSSQGGRHSQNPRFRNIRCQRKA